jgi:glycerophosphoryl diester phosphodiesterase
VLDERGTNIGDFVMFNDTQGLVIERGPSQGDTGAFKAIFTVTLGDPGSAVEKEQTVDLLNIADPAGISEGGGLPGDVGLGDPFAFPFQTIRTCWSSALAASWCSTTTTSPSASAATSGPWLPTTTSS